MSDSDIDKGSRGIEEISKALDTIEVGISCLTPENLTAPWLLFEGGALSKRIGDKSRLCTYLIGGLKNSDVPQPLGMFQHTVATDKAETRKLLESVNLAINPSEPVKLERVFEKMWPDLEDAVKNLPAAEKKVVPERPERDMIAEILDTVRTLNSKVPRRNSLAMLRDALVDVGITEADVSYRCSKCGSSELNHENPALVKCVKCGAVNSFVSILDA
jgi:uncharacterized protein YjiS (DUF1127 family)